MKTPATGWWAWTTEPCTGVSGRELTRVPIRHPLEGTRIWDFTRDRQGVLWISTYSGLLKIDRGVETFWTMDDGLPTHQIRSTKEDRRGRLWLATQNAGLVWLEDPAGPVFDALDEEGGLPSSFVFSIDETAAGELVVGTLRGPALVSVGPAGPRARVLYDTPDSLPGLVVFNTLLDETVEAQSDSELKLWMATDGGLGRLEGREIWKIQGQDGLPVEAIFDVQRDARGSLWMSSSVGVIRANERELLA